MGRASSDAVVGPRPGVAVSAKYRYRARIEGFLQSSDGASAGQGPDSAERASPPSGTDSIRVRRVPQNVLGVDSAAMASPVATAELIGRALELDALDEALSRATDGSPEIVIVAGEAGIGKSRLIVEFADRARARGALVLHGACLDLAEGGM